MDDQSTSRTALFAAMIRAVHSESNSPLLRDSFAGTLLSASEQEALAAAFLGMLSAEAREAIEAQADRALVIREAVRSFAGAGNVIVRARYAEDCLQLAIDRGMGQYVLVGAGMDTFSLRRDDLMHKLRVFELDHPATQTDKLERLSRAGLAAPENTEFVAANLEVTAVETALSGTAYSSTRPAFFSWLGVTGYLSREANLSTLKSIAACAAPGSELVFNYMARSAELDRPTGEERRISASFADASQPIRSAFRPEDLRHDLEVIGFEVLEDIGPDDLRKRYLTKSDEALPMTRNFRITLVRLA